MTGTCEVALLQLADHTERLVVNRADATVTVTAEVIAAWRAGAAHVQRGYDDAPGDLFTFGERTMGVGRVTYRLVAEPRLMYGAEGYRLGEVGVLQLVSIEHRAPCQRCPRECRGCTGDIGCLCLEHWKPRPCDHCGQPVCEQPYAQFCLTCGKPVKARK